MQIWVTTQELFPFGWRQLPGSALTGDTFVDTAGVFHLGRWWIFASVGCFPQAVP